MHKAILPSSVFKNQYAIFISRSASGMFDQYIRARQWRSNYNIRTINAEFDPELSCILIPLDLNYSLFEKELFDIKQKDKSSCVRESQFWGQIELGYDGRHWTII